MWRTNFPNLSENIYKSSFILSKSGLKSLYYSMVYPYLFYCNIVWASTYKTNLLLTCSSCDSTKVRDPLQIPSTRSIVGKNVLIFGYLNQANLCILINAHFYPLGLEILFLLIIRLITTIQEMLLLLSYPSVEQTRDNFLQAIRRGS